MLPLKGKGLTLDPPSIERNYPPLADSLSLRSLSPVPLALSPRLTMFGLLAICSPGVFAGDYCHAHAKRCPTIAHIRTPAQGYIGTFSLLIWGVFCLFSSLFSRG